MTTQNRSCARISAVGENDLRTSRVALALVAGLVATAAAACAPHARPTVVPEATPPLRVQVRTDGRTTVLSIPLETYVRGVIVSEVAVPAADRDLALRIYEIQAVLARTYAVANRRRHAREGFDLCDGTHCQVFRRHDGPQPEWRSRAADRAVATTAGVIASFRGRPIQAVYHANCGGHTSDATTIWGGVRVAYLTGIDDPSCQRRPAAWTYDVPLERLRQVLNRHATTHVGRRLTSVAVAARDPTGVATSVHLVGDDTRTLRGEELRSIMNAAFGATAIRSPKYSVTVSPSVASFAGTGSGHGVGLCQTGAMARLRGGDSPQLILETYYPGVALGAVRP